MSKEINEETKPIEELDAVEALIELSKLAAKRREVQLLEQQEEALVERVNAFNKPVLAMDLEELKAEVMRLDALKCDVIKPFYDRQKEVLEALKIHTGAGFEWEGDEPLEGTEGIHWQDENGIVWATEKITGTFVEFRDFGVTRTRDLSRGESKGLSMTKARKLGYVVEGK